MKRILITGALGQIGSELSVEFSRRYGNENVVVSDINNDVDGVCADNAFEKIDTTDIHALEPVVRRHDRLCRRDILRGGQERPLYLLPLVIPNAPPLSVILSERSESKNLVFHSPPEILRLRSLCSLRSG